MKIRKYSFLCSRQEPVLASLIIKTVFFCGFFFFVGFFFLKPWSEIQLISFFEKPLGRDCLESVNAKQKTLAASLTVTAQRSLRTGLSDVLGQDRGEEAALCREA